MKFHQLLFCFLLIVQVHLSAAETPSFSIGKTPSWKTKIALEMPDRNYSTSGDATYLLVDWQENELLKESCYRYALRLNNEQGVQNNAQLSFSFDPTYQQLSISKIVLHRGSQEINHLNRSEIELMRNEKNADYLIYDGTWSAIVILKDVRVGDVLEYEYTIKGQNPIFKDQIYNNASLGFGSEVIHNYQRVLVPSNAKLIVKEIQGGQQPVVEDNGQIKSMVWDLKNQPAVFTDANIPSWYNAYPACEISSYSDWNMVKLWGRNLFPVDLSANSLDAFLQERKFGKSEQGILGAIRFVQDEIRYLGMETGIHSHQPHQPEEVLRNRFGDCKDKSYLLVSMLRKLGVEAWPAYVHSAKRGQVSDYAPSPFAFNHVIVKFKWDGQFYWVDPTLNQQRGNLALNCLPNYQKALVLDENQNGLEDIPVSQTDRIVIRENLWFADSVSEVRYEVETVFYGNFANSKRVYHLGTPIAEIRENYLNFCSGYYSGLKWASDSALQYTDFPDLNSFKVKESYLIPDFWTHSGADSVDLYSAVEPYNLYEFLSYSKDQARKMPLSMYYPVNVEYTINMHFPKHKALGFVGKTTKLENEAFTFSKTSYVTKSENTYSINYTYFTKNDHVPVAQLVPYFKDYNKLSELCNETIQWGVSAETSGKVNWTAVVTAIVFILLLIRILMFIYQSDFRYVNPEKQALKFYGWILLPVIGLYFTPLLVTYQIFNTGYFSAGLLENFMAQRTDLPAMMEILFYFELLFNVLIVVLSVFLIILSIQKRITFPKLYIFFRVFVLVGIVFDSVVSAALLNSDLEGQNELVRTIIGSAVWIPYFIYSKQVKATFVKTYKQPVSSDEFAGELTDSADNRESV
ncbi:MAG: DUF3857 domain-containing protein [Prolixibacteraceae bacterium]|nr:DUF3857 domain-containing protein [Prolixibacteraceae bacterium]